MIFLNIRQKNWIKVLDKAKNMPSNVDENNNNIDKQHNANSTDLDATKHAKDLVAKEGEMRATRLHGKITS